MKYIFIRALTYVVLKTVSSLMANCNVVKNLELFTLFGTNSHIFHAKNISECVTFYSFSTSGFKTEASFNEKISFMRSGEKTFKSSNNSIITRCEFLVY